MSTRILVVALAGVFLMPATAHAATYCVLKPSCPGGVAKPTLGDALAAADATEEVDDIQLGVGKFVGHWSHNSLRPVRISGVGPLTRITPDDADHPALTITGSYSTLSNVGIQIGAGAALHTGLRLTRGARGDRIVVSAETGANNGTGVKLGAGATFTRSDVILGGTVNSMTGVVADGDGVTISDVVVSAARGVRTVKDTLVQRAEIASAGGALTVDAGRTRVESTLLDVREGGVGVEAAGEADLSHVTIVGAGIPSRIAVLAKGAAQVTVRDAILAGMSITYSAAPQASLTLDHVVRDPAATATGIATDTDPITTLPEFTQAGNDPFALAPGSALVDTGSTVSLAAGESELDLDGDPRITDGTGDCVARRDPGAYETDAAPACPAPGPPTTGGAPVPAPEPPVVPAPVAETDEVDDAAPVITRLKLTRAKLTFTAGEAAKVTIKIKGTKTRTVTKTVKPGRNSIALRLRPGRYRVLIAVVDLAGNRTSLRRSL
jgi:hypothetical protein